MSADLATFLFEAVNFALLAAALGWVFFRPVQEAIETRRAALEAERRAAELDRSEAAQRLAEVETRRRELEASLDAQRAAARHEAEAEVARSREAARRAAEEEAAAVRAGLATLRRGHAVQLARDAAGATRLLVERLLAEVGGPDLDLALVRAALRRWEGLSHARHGTVLVEAARPLSAAAHELLAGVLSAAGAPPPQVRIVPALVGGLRIATDAGLIDVSITGMGREVERELAARLEREAEARSGDTESNHG